jgi:hypothetical protein
MKTNKNVLPDAQVLVDSTGREMGVFIPYSSYIQLLSDIQDINLFNERKDEPLISSNEMKRKLKKLGKL